MCICVYRERENIICIYLIYIVYVSYIYIHMYVCIYIYTILCTYTYIYMYIQRWCVFYICLLKQYERFATVLLGEFSTWPFTGDHERVDRWIGGPFKAIGKWNHVRRSCVDVSKCDLWCEQAIHIMKHPNFKAILSSSWGASCVPCSSPIVMILSKVWSHYRNLMKSPCVDGRCSILRTVQGASQERSRLGSAQHVLPLA